MDALLQQLGDMISQNFSAGIFIAFIAGMLTVFTPCSLSSIPLIVAYVGGTSDNKKKSFLYSLLICLGQSIAFIAMGLMAASMGMIMGLGGLAYIWYAILAVLMVWMAFEMFGITHVFEKGKSVLGKIKIYGASGAFIIGVVGALFTTPCSTPVLAAMLAYVSASGAGIASGAILLTSYSLGHGILLVIAGTFFGFVQSLSDSGKFIVAGRIIRIVFGILMLLLATYFIYKAFYQ